MLIPSGMLKFSASAIFWSCWVSKMYFRKLKRIQRYERAPFSSSEAKHIAFDYKQIPIEVFGRKFNQKRSIFLISGSEMLLGGKYFK